jgi:oligopeptide/dipeptide ABC transporter ATP-binding protein
MPPLLEAHQVSKRFGGGLFDRRATLALEHFSFRLEEASPAITAVVGESGSGKTTLARLLLGMLTPTRGAVRYRGQDLQRMGHTAWRAFRREVQVIFQDPYEVYNPFYRVDHVLTTPVAKFHLAPTKSATRTLIADALTTVGLRPEETLGRFPHQLSGGQRQRVMVARALLLKPRIILADEPVSMVDASLRATILASLRSLTIERGIAILYITHDLATAYQISENIIVLYRGAVAEAGAVAPIVQTPQHPYTQLLISSIPVASAERTWGQEPVARPALPMAPLTGCKFADRCPFAMAPCLAASPPLYQVAPHRVVACYRYQGAPILPAEDLGAALVGPAEKGTVTVPSP